MTNIEENAFYNCSSLANITIPEGVKIIGNYAFSRSGLSSITIPASVTALGEYAFSSCSSLTRVRNLGQMNTLGKGVFRSCGNLTSVTIPENVTDLGEETFYGCTNLASITIPEGVTSFGNKAFYGCTSLIDMSMPNSVTSLGEEVFYGCTSLTSATISNRLTEIAPLTFCGCSSLAIVTIPEGVTTMGRYAFDSCTGLTDITIPKSVTSIGSGAFSGCTSLTNITIPESVTSIGNYAFAACSGLTSIVIPSSVTKIESSTFSGCTGLTSIVIPSSVTNIGSSAFSGCRSLTSITIPNGITGIEYGTFANCTSLTNINIPSGVTFIGYGAFRGCTSLTSVTIPDGTKAINPEAFAQCESLTSIVIPKSVEYIGFATFAGCSQLKEFTCLAEEVPIVEEDDYGYSYLFDGTKCADGKLYVPFSSMEKYKAAKEWKDWGTIIGIEYDTDISDIDNTIYLDNCEAFSGKTIELPIKMKNDIAATGFQFDIILPDGITAVQDEDGFYDITLSTERTTAAKTNTFDSSLMSDGSIRVLAASTRNYAFSGNDGEVCTIKLKVNEDLPAGDYPIILKNIELTNAQGQTWNVERLKRTLTIVDYIIGDANGDTRVSVGDFSAIASHIMGDTPEGFIVMAADVNGDTRVSVGDLSAVVPLIMSDTETHDLAKGMKAKRRDNAMETDISDLDNVIYADAVTIVPGQDSEIVLNMKNSIAATGFQFDVYLPAGISVPEVEEGIYDASLSTIRTTTAKTNTFECGLMNDGSYRVLAASTRNAVFEGNDGEVVRIRLHAEEELAEGSYPIYLRNIELTNAQGQTYNTNELVSQLTVENGASIYAEGYALDITPFEFNEDVEIPILLDNADDITNIEFDLMLPQAFIDSELYYVDAKLAKTKFTTNIGDINGGVHVAIARRSSNKIAAGEDTEVSVLGLIFEDVAEGLYTVEAKNITATTTDGDEVKVAPYKASVLVGNPPLAGEVTLYGKYTSAENAIIEYVIANDDANVTVENVILSDDECFNTANEFVAEHVAYDAEVSASLGYKTLVLPYDCAVPVGFEAYEVGSVTGNTLNMEPVNTITANKPVILKNAGTAKMEAMNVTINATNGETYTDGVLVGTYKTINAPVGSYVLQNQEGNVAFYCVGETVQPVVNPFRAYLELTSMKAKVVNLNFGDDVTSINLETGMPVDGDIYNANGVRTAKMHRGVNIVRTGKGVMKVLK